MKKIGRLRAIRQSVEYARNKYQPATPEYKAALFGYLHSLEELCVIKTPRPKHRVRAIGAKIRSTKRKLIEMGIHPGGRAPFGYDVVNGRLVINHQQDAAISMMLQMYPRGMSYEQIAEAIQKKLNVKVSRNGVRKICLGLRVTPIP